MITLLENVCSIFLFLLGVKYRFHVPHNCPQSIGGLAHLFQTMNLDLCEMPFHLIGLDPSFRCGVTTVTAKIADIWSIKNYGVPRARFMATEWSYIYIKLYKTQSSIQTLSISIAMLDEGERYSC